MKMLRWLLIAAVVTPIFVTVIWVVCGLFGMLTCCSAAFPGRVSAALLKSHGAYFFWHARWVYWPGLFMIAFVGLGSQAIGFMLRRREGASRRGACLDPDTPGSGGFVIGPCADTDPGSQLGAPLCRRCGSPMTWTDGPDVNDQNPRYYCPRHGG
jgi:hypothetical protein